MNCSGKTLCDFLDYLPREWISEDLMEALAEKGVYLSPTMCVKNCFAVYDLINCIQGFWCHQTLCRYQVGDWVKYRRSINAPTYGWQDATHKSVGFVQAIRGNDLIVSFCSGEARALINEVIKVIPLDRGQHVQLKSDVKEPRYFFYMMKQRHFALGINCSLNLSYLFSSTISLSKVPSYNPCSF